MARDSDSNDPYMKELEQDDSDDCGATEISEQDDFDSDDPLNENKSKKNVWRKMTYWNEGIVQACISRFPMLNVLLMLQSVSSLILQEYAEGILERHVTISIFLTMLVGTGGNAGGQSAAVVLQGLASQEIKPSHSLQLFIKELSIASVLSFLVSFCGFLRVWIQTDSRSDALVISIILFFIVLTSIGIGTFLPLGFSMLQKFVKRHMGKRAGSIINPANTTFPTFQVVTDLVGIVITVVVADLMYGQFDY